MSQRLVFDRITTAKLGPRRKHHWFTAAAGRISIPMLVGLLAVSYYIFHLGRDLSWTNLGSDSGELIAASFTLGIPHPPGYPTYVLLGKLFSFIPIGSSIAFRFNLFSAVAMAAAAAIVAAGANRMIDVSSVPQKRSVVLAVGLSFALFPLIFSQAIVAEVYALNLAVLAFLIWLCLAPANQQRPLVIGLLMGLAMTTHLTSLLVLPLVLLSLRAESYLRFAVGLGLGLVPFLLLPLLAASSSPILWGDLASLRGWLWLVSAELYHPNIAPGGVLKIGLAIFLAVSTMAFLFSIVHQKRRRLNADRTISLTSMLIVTAGLYFIFSSQYKTSDAVVFLLPGVLMLFVIASRLLNKLGRITIILPLILLAINLMNGRNIDDISPRARGEGILSGTSEGAVLITEDEQTLFSLWYLQHVEGIRPDVTIVDKNMLQFNWYRMRLSQRYPDLTNLDAFDVAGFIEGNTHFRTICRADPKADEQVTCDETGTIDT